MEADWVKKLIDRYGLVALSAISLVSFFSIYAWAFRYFLPFEVRVFIGTDFYAKLGLELVLAISVSSLFAKGVDFQIRNFLSNLRARELDELRFEKCRRLYNFLMRIDPSRAGRLVFFIVFVLSFVFYFSGLWISLLVLIMCYPIIDSIGFKAEAEMLSDGKEVPYTTNKVGVGLRYIIERSNSVGFLTSIPMLALIFLEIALAIGAGRFLQAAFGNDVFVSGFDDEREYRIIASSMDGVILMDSREASLLNLLTSSDVSYLIITASGEYITFGK